MPEPASDPLLAAYLAGVRAMMLAAWEAEWPQGKRPELNEKWALAEFEGEVHG